MSSAVCIAVLADSYSANKALKSPPLWHSLDLAIYHYTFTVTGLKYWGFLMLILSDKDSSETINITSVFVMDKSVVNFSSRRSGYTSNIYNWWYSTLNCSELLRSFCNYKSSTSFCFGMINWQWHQSLAFLSFNIWAALFFLVHFCPWPTLPIILPRSLRKFTPLVAIV